MPTIGHRRHSRSDLLSVLAQGKESQHRKPPKPVEQIVPEPAMPREMNDVLEFSTGDNHDSNEDEIVTEVFVRTESVPPEEADTIDDLPGKLLARTRRAD